MAFSFISITTGIFTTYAFALTTGGTRSIWTWPIVIAGQALVALVYGALSIRVPLSGYSYQWASRLANPHVGWWFGWMSFAFLTIVTVSVDYGLVQVAFQPLIGADVHADQRGAGDAGRAGPAGGADHHLDPDHHPGEQHRGGHRDHRHRRADRRCC